MEGAVLIGMIGAAIGAALAAFLFGVDLIIGTHLVTEERAVGIVIVAAVLTPAVAGLICLFEDQTWHGRPPTPPPPRDPA